MCHCSSQNFKESFLCAACSIFFVTVFMKNQFIFYYKQKGSFINLQLLKKYRPRSPQPRSPTSIMKLGLVGGHL